MSDTIYYTNLNSGSEDDHGNFVLKEDGPEAYAKTVRTQNIVKHMVRIDPSHKLLNPFDYDNQTEFSGHKNFVDNTCKGSKTNRYTRVNGKCFNYYLSFLKTKNLAWLVNAERENN